MNKLFILKNFSIITIIFHVNIFTQNLELYHSLNFQKAYKNQTRSTTGLPGLNY